MADSVWHILARNEAEDGDGWARRDGNGLSWPHGPRPATRKRWEILHWADRAIYEFDTLDNAIAALNKQPEDDGLTFTTGPGAPVHHTKRLWYSLRAGRCPKKLLELVSTVWVRPASKSASAGSTEPAKPEEPKDPQHQEEPKPALTGRQRRRVARGLPP